MQARNTRDTVAPSIGLSALAAAAMLISVLLSGTGGAQAAPADHGGPVQAPAPAAPLPLPLPLPLDPPTSG